MLNGWVRFWRATKGLKSIISNVNYIAGAVDEECPSLRQVEGGMRWWWWEGRGGLQLIATDRVCQDEVPYSLMEEEGRGARERHAE